jgi:hypothetical protein
MSEEYSKEELKNILRKHAAQLLEDFEMSDRLAEGAKAEYARLMALAKELMAAIDTGRLTKGEAEAKWRNEWAPFSKYCDSLVDEVLTPMRKDLGIVLGIEEDDQAEAEDEADEDCG